MNNLIMGLSILTVLYFTFLDKGEFETDIVFNGEAYEHQKMQDSGWVTSHYYTRAGEDIKSAKGIIHILEFDKKLIRGYWRKPLFNTISQYGLKTIGTDEYDMAGSFEKSGVNMHSYGTPINVNGQDNLAFYISNEYTLLSKYEMLSELRKISMR
ncbi:MAG: hypothetical protein V7785_23035 [Bermanella sp.]